LVVTVVYLDSMWWCSQYQVRITYKLKVSHWFGLSPNLGLDS